MSASASRSVPTSATRRGLTQADFRPLARGGFGNPHNSYPHALVWFRDQIYVTTTRDNLVLVKLRYPFDIPLAVWPVRVPGDVWDLDLRVQIWRYDPPTGRWSNAYTSPLVKAPNGRDTPLSIAFRSMTVYQGASDPEPAMYATTHPPQPLKHLGSTLMRSLDGTLFEAVPEIGHGLGIGKFRSFRALQPFKGRLFTAPAMAGAAPGIANVAGVALVLASTDPVEGVWELACEPNFGDPQNTGVFEMGVANGFLYAGVINLIEGFQLWKTTAEGRPPYRWTRVLTRGAFRGKLNQGTVAMTAFGEHLYVGTAIQGGGYDRERNVGPAAAELLRIAPDDTWDLIVGDTRDTPDGMKVPLSGYGAGFGNPFAGYFWRMCEHEGWLYLGTFDSSILLSWCPEDDKLPEYLRNLLNRRAIEAFVERFGGFDLWRSRDGIRWTPVTRNGMGNRFNYGARTMVSTPFGLVLGANNPFGPDLAVRRAGGWAYEPNPAGGAEIWLGSTEHADEGGGASARPHLLDHGVGRAPGVAPDPAVCESLVRAYYGDSGFRHFGFWGSGVTDARHACENLVEELLSLLPEKQGTVVDAGCGRGATTAHLLRHYASEAVTGVTVGAQALALCRDAAPGVRFLAGFPALRLPDASVDTILCVEGLAFLRGKEAALGEMLRVLRPGGRIILADVIDAAPGGSGTADAAGDPTDVVGYEPFLRRVGFEEIKVVDATYECWTKYSQHRTLYFCMRLFGDETDPSLVESLRDLLPGGRGGVTAYVLVTARRPDAEAGR